MRPTLLAGVTAVVLSAGQLAAAFPCPPPPCDGVDDCALRSDWVVEGTLQSVIPGETHRFCVPGGPPQDALCGGVTDVPRLVLKDVVVVSGASPLFRRRPVEIMRAYNCLSGRIQTVPGQSVTNVDQRYLGRRLRFIGTNVLHSSEIFPGYLVAEFLPAPD